MEHKINIKMNKNGLIGVTFHIGCMIDRLIEKKHAVDFLDKLNFIEKNRKLFEIVRENIEFFNLKYKVQISEDEICHITRFFNLIVLNP